LPKKNLAALHYTNIDVVVGDGTEGYPQNSPYDGIMITAATPQVPQPLIDQLTDAGRLVAPVGKPGRSGDDSHGKNEGHRKN